MYVFLTSEESQNGRYNILITGISPELSGLEPFQANLTEGQSSGFHQFDLLNNI